ncbi:zinc metalloprotease [Aquimarina sediminis]|uniref:zinc metalloprotease n=1 Tax=Aquimarina sediminis TaxID=2070536 RepID=UPI000CA08E05|nr:zinc metalloprotease [Aquimarina sediminis]
MIKQRFVVVAVLLATFFYSCSEDDTNLVEVPEEVPIVPPEEIIRIPVVIHVINPPSFPFVISDQKIHSQIDVLNQDFRKKNPDHVKTPDEFKDLVADVGIEFYIATKDPNGQPTTGITRTESDISGFSGDDITGELPIEEYKLFFTNKGGKDIWPSNKYLNIYIADLSDRWGRLGLAGYAHFPDKDPRVNAVVIDPRVFGTLQPLESEYTLGRTATHEIGHWLNLKHIYGRDGSCDEGDEVDDTPDQKSQNLGKPVYPKSSCGGNEMFMNFMDRVDDDTMYMFTKGQKDRMRALFNEGGARRELYLNTKEK